jgi:putative transposase
LGDNFTILDTFKKGRIRMARKLYTPEQIIGKLRAIEVHMSTGLTAQQAARREEVAEQTYYRWRKMYGGIKLDADDHR